VVGASYGDHALIENRISMAGGPPISFTLFMIAGLSVPHSKRILCVLSGRPRTLPRLVAPAPMTFPNHK
jgi:hypothetical protein